MKKIVASLIILNCALANAYEYSSDHDNQQRYDREHNEWYESNSRHAPPPRYWQNQPQPPIQIFLSPNMNDYGRNHNKTYRRHENKQYREERYWQRRREELEQRPRRREIENPYYQDDTHW